MHSADGSRPTAPCWPSSILVLGFLVLALWDSPPLVGVIVVAVLVIVLEALVFFLAKQSELAVEAAGAREAADKAG